MFHLSYFIRSFVIIEQLVLSFTDEGFFVLTDDKSLAVTIPLSDIICRRVVFQQNYMFSDKANVISTDNFTAPEWNASTQSVVKRKVHIVVLLKFYKPNLHIPADTRSAFPVISVQSPVSIQCCWQS